MRLPLVFLTAALCCAAQSQRHVILITLDGYPAYALRDPQTPAPTLRKLIQEGAWAQDGMTPVNPTVTWPNHTAMVTGVDASRHQVLYNGLPVRENNRIRIDPWVDKSELVKAPTVYDVAHKAGLKTAEVDWVAIQNTPSIDWSFAEVPRPEAAVPREMVAAGLVTEAAVRDFSKAPITFRDEIWAQAAMYILRVHKPNLMMVHFLTTDTSQHRYGARSLGAISALALADRQVERLIDAVRSAGMLDTTTFVIAADHGFHTAKRLIRPAVLLKETGAIVMPEGGTAMIYGTVSPDKFKGVEGISEILTPAEFARYGYPAQGGRMADLVLAAADGYAFTGGAEGPVVADAPPNTTPGNHGYLSTRPDMRPIFVAWGAGIRRGAKLEDVHTVDIAPTIARLLGLEMKDTLGHALTAALQ
jgi:predicted AlkP superfamily pyrophosphatase or phosphodiesterase